ncbi:MSHA biogenesis protein MshL [Desulfacinum hydrothermale DSM 13146]|uniref:MSHA biogenesis protein MshL n=1 Tax=Desulfacinum hydrothermale DSM 13146 TaxID=1121390 RepID=A0A1W1X6E3_9BACT|nr:hypothetical protein [Desulfacinum hydrothermale]SMC19041.1 MSHA biogenesis protein MshL [Desulfacinum hydrothermale DSM 13146]
MKPEHRLSWFALFVMLFVLVSCAGPNMAGRNRGEARLPSSYLHPPKGNPPPGPPALEEKVQPYVPPSPQESKLYSLQFDGAPLSAVLAAIAQEADLNLIVQKGLDLSLPVYVRLSNATLDEALQTVVVQGADYAYKVDAGSLLVQRFEEEIFHVEYLRSKRKTTTKVGGDILGSAMETAGGGGGSSAVTSEFRVETEDSDETADIWGQIKSALEALKSPEGTVLVQPYAGTIYVADVPSRMSSIRRFIERLKEVVKRQVLIDAKLLEVQLSDSNQMGIQWDLLQERLSLFGAEGALTLVQNLGAGLASGTGATISSPGTGGAAGLSLTKGATALNVLIDFLRSQGQLRVLSNPQIAVMNGQSAVITVGSQLPFGDVSGLTVDQNGNVLFESSIKRALLGLQLGISPQIADDGEILLHVVPSITNLQGEEVVDIPTAGSSVQQVRNPIISLREMGTMVRVREGQSVVLAGLIRRNDSWKQDKVPLAGDIPLLGGLFRNHRQESESTELVVILTPRLM